MAVTYLAICDNCGCFEWLDATPAALIKVSEFNRRLKEREHWTHTRDGVDLCPTNFAGSGKIPMCTQEFRGYRKDNADWLKVNFA
jgi:hypothetical protein